MKKKINKKNIPTKYPLVHVEWEDAYSTGVGWQDKEDLKRLYDNKNCIIHSIGFLIENNKKYIILASQYDSQDTLYGRTIRIPRSWCKVKRLVYK